MIQSLLIANRGEIACRIIRTARAMGIRTVAVYSDADAKALHVRQADEAVHIGASPARESYLVGEKIIAAALATKAEAIHPGYGFLSENAEFAQAVIDAGLIWVGPAPASITAMGLKDAAKTLMAAAGVPVTPGYMGEDQDPKHLAAEAEKIGYPVLIKAVAGGGGKGMRKVEDAVDFADSLASCQREATASFGNAHVLIEKYIQRPRHIEVQVFGDTHGNIVHLFERDCSLQRRHQKVIEEAPAPGMDEATREQLCAAAVKAAKAVDYVGAGTIEFIADASEGLRADRIWFMEMNTRLQVEHPVTEEITGVDLVEWQLRVASGEALPKRQDELSINGHAIEGRVYAEDPANGFLPSIGRLDFFKLGEINFAFDPRDIIEGPHTFRVDTGFEISDSISPHYDPMLAKVIVHGSDRQSAIGAFVDDLSKSGVFPVKSNVGLLIDLVDHQEFRSGDVATDFVERTGVLNQSPEPIPDVTLTEIWSQMSQDSHTRDPVPVFHDLAGFRMNRHPDQLVPMYVDGKRFDFEPDHSFFEPEFEKPPFIYVPERGEAHGHLFYKGRHHLISQELRMYGSGGGSAASGTILSPMPGRIIAVEVTAGQTVSKGQKLLTLEAMKMEHTLTAPFDGTVAELNAEPGAQVQVEALLVRIEAV